MPNKYSTFTDSSFHNGVRGIIQEASYFKTKIFRAGMSSSKINMNDAAMYKNAVKRFIESWESKANELADAIKESKGVEGVHSIEYDFVKKFIYDKDDYASILPFMDGLIIGIEKGKFEKSDEVNEFYIHTVNKAFHQKGDSTAQLIDAVTYDANSEYHPVDSHEAKMYNSIRNYKIFPSTDILALKRSVIKAIDYMVTPEYRKEILPLREFGMKPYISVINHVVDYVVFSITAFACKVHIIGKYAAPFINNSYGGNAIDARYESVKDDKDVKDDIHIDVTIMKVTDEILTRDISKYKILLDQFDEFAKVIGCDLTDARIHDSSNAQEIINNNDLLLYLMRKNGYTHDEEYNLVKELITIPNQGIDGTGSSKQELLYTIRKLPCDNTIKGCQELTTTLVMLATRTLDMLQDNYNAQLRHQAERLNTTELSSSRGLMKIYADLYAEISVAILHRLRDVELQYNHINCKNNDHYNDMTTLKLPFMTSDLDTGENMMSAVPETTRVSYEIMDIYDSSKFEAMQMYDEYLQTLPEFADTYYFNEAGVMSNIFNYIISHVASVVEKFMTFITDARFQNRLNWVKNNESELRAINCNGKKMTILKFKNDIRPSEMYKNLKDNLKKFDTKVLSSQEEKDKFIKSLYPDGVYDWFHGDNKDNAKNLFRNAILFYDSIPNTKVDVISGEVAGNDLSKYLGIWIDNIKGADAIKNALNADKNEITAAVNNIKSKLVVISSQPQQPKPSKPQQPAQQNQQNKADNTGADALNPPPTNIQSTTQPASGQPAGTKTEHDAFMLQIQNAIFQLWATVPRIIMQEYIVEGDYLKQLYDSK